MLSSHGLPTFSPRANSVLNSATTAFQNGARSSGGSSRYKTRAVAVYHHDQRAGCSWHWSLEVCRWYYSNPVYLSNELEGVQKRAMRIIFPLCSYNEALVESGLTKLSDRRQELVDKLFKNVLQNEQNKLHELLPARNTCTFNLRNMRKFKPAFKTNRFRSSFITFNAA